MTLLELPTIRRGSESPLIATLLAEQQTLTAVEQFSRAHDSGHAASLDRNYRELMPLAEPQPGEQYAFTVDLDACSGCKACVTACHSLNGLDESETFRDVGLLTGRDSRGLHVLQHVTTACHHCVEPACLSGCPTQAYDKDPVTGIVRHLDDQCFGCQYCTLMCPYDVPKYNPAKGIVRKCDMCWQRLSDSEAPACVQACPNKAIRIELVRTSDARQRAAAEQFLPQAPDPRLTIPTTRFVTKRPPLRDAEVAENDVPAHAHLPLVFMLVLTQMSIGMIIVAEGLLVAGIRSTATLLAALIIGAIGLAAAVLHLGRPQIAYRAWIGWRTSWMSREIIAFHVWLGLAALFALATTQPQLQIPVLACHALGCGAAVAGIVALVCSAMIYVVTRRDFWNARQTIPQFAATAALLGPIGALATLAATGGETSAALVGVVIAATLWRLLAGTTVHDHSANLEATQLARSADLLTGSLRGWNGAQVVSAIFGGLILPMTLLQFPAYEWQFVLVATMLLVIAELIQRGLFFAAAVGPRMPGVIHS